GNYPALSVAVLALSDRDTGRRQRLGRDFQIALCALLHLLGARTIAMCIIVKGQCLGVGEQKVVCRHRAQVLTKFCENLIDTYQSFLRKLCEEILDPKTCLVAHRRRRLCPSWERKVIPFGGRYAQIQDW